MENLATDLTSQAYPRLSFFSDRLSLCRMRIADAFWGSGYQSCHSGRQAPTASECLRQQRC
eukprot:768182-Hanusia_phi.AAC.3